jgi:hypothetical protein
MRYKDLWFAEMERKLSEKTSAGVPWDKAYEDASNEAFDSSRDLLADKVDILRKRAREG